MFPGSLLVIVVSPVDGTFSYSLVAVANIRRTARRAGIALAELVLAALAASLVELALLAALASVEAALAWLAASLVALAWLATALSLVAAALEAVAAWLCPEATAIVALASPLVALVDELSAPTSSGLVAAWAVGPKVTLENKKTPEATATETTPMLRRRIDQRV